MDISGSYTLHAPQERVWNALLDPDLLKRTVPGCELLERTGEDTYRLRLNVGVAAVKGIYDGKLRLTEQQPYDHYRMIVEGKGARGVLHGDGTLTLSERGANGTLVSYKGQAQLGGTIAGVGMRVADGAANMLIKAYFSKLADALAESALASAPAVTTTSVATSETVSDALVGTTPNDSSASAAPAASPPADAPTAATASAIPPVDAATAPAAEVATPGIAIAAAAPISAAPQPVPVAPAPTASPITTASQPAAAASAPIAPIMPQRGPLMRLARRTGLTDGSIESEQRWARGMLGGIIGVGVIVFGILAILLGR